MKLPERTQEHIERKNPYFSWIQNVRILTLSEIDSIVAEELDTIGDCSLTDVSEYGISFLVDL